MIPCLVFNILFFPNSKKFNMTKKDFLIVLLKVVVFTATAFLSVLGVSTLTSCNASKSVDVEGRTHILTTDTTIVNHKTFVSYPKVK